MLRFLIEKEFKQIRRNGFVPRILVAMPLAMMLVFPWAANQEIRNVRLAVVDGDGSTTSRRLTEKIASSGYFHLADVAPTLPAAMRSIDSGKADIVLEIASGFEAATVAAFGGEGLTGDFGSSGGVSGSGGAHESSRIMISANAVNGMKGSLGASYLQSIVSDYGVEIAKEQGVTTATSGFSIVPRYRFNPTLDYKVFMVPALMVMLLTMLCGFLPALNIVAEKEAGTIEQMNVTPVRRLDFVLSKLIPYWLIGFAVLIFCMILAWFVYGLRPAGGVLTIFLFTGIYLLVVSGVGLLISNYSDTMQQAMFVMFFFILIFLLISGLFTPVRSMPVWAQTIAAINPLKYFIEVMRLAYLKGSGLTQLWPQLAALCGFAIVFNAWAVASYKKQR